MCFAPQALRFACRIHGSVDNGDVNRGLWNHSINGKTYNQLFIVIIVWESNVRKWNIEIALNTCVSSVFRLAKPDPDLNSSGEPKHLLLRLLCAAFLLPGFPHAQQTLTPPAFDDVVRRLRRFVPAHHYLRAICGVQDPPSTARTSHRHQPPFFLFSRDEQMHRSSPALRIGIVAYHSLLCHANSLYWFCGLPSESQPA